MFSCEVDFLFEMCLLWNSTTKQYGWVGISCGQCKWGRGRVPTVKIQDSKIKDARFISYYTIIKEIVKSNALRSIKENETGRQIARIHKTL